MVYQGGGSTSVVPAGAVTGSCVFSVPGMVDYSQVEVGLYDGDKLIGKFEPDYSYSSSLAYVSSLLGFHGNLSVWSDGTNYTDVCGTLYIAKTLEEGKNYALKGTVAGQAYDWGYIFVSNDVEVYAYSTGLSSDKPVIGVNLTHITYDQVVVQLVKDGNIIASSANGGQVIPSDNENAYFELDTTKDAAYGAKIRVLDKKGNLLYAGSTYSDYPGIAASYYNYQDENVVLVTNSVPDNTELKATIQVEEETYSTTAVVSDNHAVLNFTKDGAALELSAGFYAIIVSYTVQENEYTSSPYISINKNGQDESTYNSATPRYIDAGKTSQEFKILLSKSYVTAETGDFTAQLWYNNQEQVGETFALSVSETQKNNTPAYEMKGTWSGDALAVGTYTLRLYRGEELVSNYYINVLDPDKVYGSIYGGTYKDGSALASIYIPMYDKYDMSKFALNVTDLLGDGVNVKVEVDTIGTNYIDYKISNIPADVTGLTFTSTYEGKVVLQFASTDEKPAEYKYVPSAYGRVHIYSNNDYAMIGIETDAAATVEFRESGTTKLLKSITLGEGMHYFTAAELEGLNYDTRRVAYNIVIKLQDGYVSSRNGVYLGVSAAPVEPDPTPVTGDKEQVTAFVSRMYTVALGREAEEAGLNDWVNKLLTHVNNGADIANGFIMGDEFKNKNYSNEEFVKVLYATFFDRSADNDQDGKAYWMGKLSEGYSRLYVLRGFVNSDEFNNLCQKFGIDRGELIIAASEEVPQKVIDVEQVSNFVERMYTKALGRASEEEGKAYWVEQITSGAWEAADVARYGFLTSDEFKNKGLNNEEFVEVLYQALFDRASDEAGKADWLNRLENLGWSREDVITGFSDSEEFYNMLKAYGLR